MRRPAAANPANPVIPPDVDAEANRRYWDAYADEYQATHGPQLEPRARWGTFSVPEADVGALGSVDGLDVLELGCGGGQWSIAIAEAGGRQVGLDASSEQLGHARANQHRHGRSFPLLQASAAHVPVRDGRFDLVFCDHGAMSYADPAATLPEVARLLRPGGRLVFNQYTPLLALCWDDGTEGPSDRLQIPYFGLGRWADVSGFVSFDLPYGEWLRLFRAHGFVVEDLIELRPPPRARTTYHDQATIAWARRFPLEHIWVTRLAG